MKKTSLITPAFTIIGNGKVSLRFVLGLLRSGVSRHFITVITRPGSLTHRDDFTQLGVTITDDISKAAEAEILTLAVRPVDAPELLSALSALSFPESAVLLSTISDVSIEYIHSVTKIPRKRIARATLNTNVDQCCGIIAITADTDVWNILQPILKGLGTVIRMKGQNLKKMVAGIGSFNAIALLYLLRRAEKMYASGMTEQQSVIASYTQALDYVESTGLLGSSSFRTKFFSFLKSVQLFQTKEVNAVRTEIESWIHAQVSCYRVLGISEKQSLLIALETLKSAAQILQRSNATTFAAIVKRINTVLTQKGCTRDGYEELKAMPTIQMMGQQLQRVVLSIYEASKNLLPKEALTPNN
jgi:pyrroline-5-carboxylate reductase